jgi:hypothetical protein
MREAKTLTIEGEAWRNQPSPASPQKAPSEMPVITADTALQMLWEALQQAGVSIDVSSPQNVPDVSRLHQNFPNPFNPDTWIPYQLAKDATVIISIYNAQGHLVRSLELGRKEAGYYLSRQQAAYWDGRNEKGERVASGVYFYKLLAGQFQATRKMVIAK